jgi:hypothetical protein
MLRLFLILTLLASFSNSLPTTNSLIPTSNNLPTKNKQDTSTVENEVSNLMKNCQSDPNSKWIRGQCYFFNKEFKSYEDAQDDCHFHFIDRNLNQTGRLYEPSSIKEFKFIYKTAKEMFEESNFWLGITKNETNFRYASNKNLVFGSAQARLPWGRKQPDGGKKENCVLAFKSRWHDQDCSSIAWSICQSSFKPKDKDVSV